MNTKAGSLRRITRVALLLAATLVAALVVSLGVGALLVETFASG